mgnify:CR=1 FL=1
MAAFVSSLIGQYSTQFLILMGSQLQLIMATLIVCIGLKPRQHYPLRILLGIAVSILLVLAAAVIRTHTAALGARMLVLLLQYASMLPLMLLCFREDFFFLLRNWCASIAMVEIGSSIFLTLVFLCGHSDVDSMSLFADFNELRDWSLYFGIRILIYLSLYLPIRHKDRGSADSTARQSIAALSLFSLVVLSLLISITSAHRAESTVLYLIIRAFIIIVAAFILLMRADITFQSQYRAEIASMEQIMAEERKQYDRNRENIEIINMRCHDLKHQLANFSGKLTKEEVKSLQEAVNIYDSTIKTGSEVLDVLIYEKQLACQQKGILLTCLADGKALSFMRTRHIYALFDNAVSNAIEAVRQLPDPEMKVISLNVSSRNGMVEIVTTNYFSGSVKFNDGLPNTTKANKNQHGFGSMSIRYIAEQYGGTMNAEAENGIYTMTVRIPVPNDTKAA